MINITDTIVAASSPPGPSLRAVLRVSGDRTAQVIQALGLRWTKPWRLERQCVGLTAQLKLPVLVCRFDAPHSYTGQDMAELQLPGNGALLERLIQRIVPAEARLAEPGEFTCRAFMAGKMDLAQAEGVAATVAAASDGQLFAAKQLRQGKLGTLASEWVDQLADALALVEAGIDFTDQEDVVPISAGDLGARLEQTHTMLTNLLEHSRAWSALEVVPHVVLAGAPSTGKSTLFNALLGRGRALIDPMPGTTRDIIAEPLTLSDAKHRPIEIMLVDIAGLDQPTSALDSQIQAQARTALEQADVILHVDDGRRHPLSLPRQDATVIHVHTKSDQLPPPSAINLSVCALTGSGLDELRRAMTAAIGDRAVSVSAQMLALQPRHITALRAAGAHLNSARQRLAKQPRSGPIQAVELIAHALRAALDDLAMIGGQMTPDDVIGRVFAHFCVGK